MGTDWWWTRRDDETNSKSPPPATGGAPRSGPVWRVSNVADTLHCGAVFRPEAPSQLGVQSPPNPSHPANAASPHPKRIFLSPSARTPKSNKSSYPFLHRRSHDIIRPLGGCPGVATAPPVLAVSA
ncbi:hypothetical protein CKAH01_10341 [Colletotrichum kahawae]|uniref:Uncharacterized protein n=1 Tax=Colletotrichum kahawae TaxID=34407 RepID=A0AAD9XZ63_COLKA|nr:hypothetical protein CKAH01_10341 [Colletotrichum kahawae]